MTEQIDPKSNGIKRSTVDFANVEHLSKFSNKWWDINGDLRVLHALNPLRIQFVRDGLANTGVKIESTHLPLEGLKILDVGCGGGFLTEPLARMGAQVTGIDVSKELIKIAKEHAILDDSLQDQLNYIETSVEDFACENKNKYDAVIASEVIEHVDDKELFLKNCVDVSQPGGSIFITTFNKTLPSWLGGIIAAERVLKVIPLGTHDWNKFISPAETQRLLERCGCKTKLIRGMCYNPLKQKWVWTKSTAITYALHAVKRKE
ncbi:ubiquinone biosynthesis O-methyltransferase, mitochondrial-like isoform X2 [Calliopsis andreniformis]